MTIRHSQVIRALLALSILASFGCTHPVLGRPALLGASVTAGAGAAVTPGKPFDEAPQDPTAANTCNLCGPSSVNAIAVNSAVAYSAVVTAAHSVPLLLGDGGVYIDPDMALHDQAVAAAAYQPTVIIAIDWLFWPVHRAVSLTLPPEERAAQRLASVDAALAELDQFECPIVTGDVPEMKHAVGKLLREEHEPGADVRAEANRRLAAWAAARPNRFVLPISHLADAVNNGSAFEVGGLCYREGEALRLLQRDGLHATPEGLAVLMAAAVDCLCAQGLAADNDCCHNLHAIAAAMEREAIDAKSRAQPSLLEGASLGAMWDRFDKLLLANDDAGAAEALEKALDRVESFDRNPLGDDDHFVDLAFTVSSLGMSLGSYPKTTAVYERHWRALKTDAMAESPQPWRFFLWLSYAKQLSAAIAKETADALAARREINGPFAEPYASMVWEERRSIGDARTLARIFPTIDEAHPLASKAARKILAWKSAARGSGQANTNWRFAYEELDAILVSRHAAGMPDESTRFYERARADGLGDLIDFGQRDARVALGSRAFVNEVRQKTGRYGSTTAGQEVFAALEVPSGAATPVSAPVDRGPRVEIPETNHADNLVSRPPPCLGFGFSEGLDGAVAVIADKSAMTIITRADASSSGSATLVRGAREFPEAATCWQELGRVGKGSPWERILEAFPYQSVAPIELAACVDLPAFADAARAAVDAARKLGAPPESASVERFASWPASVCATGSVDRAVIRVPMGWDDATQAPRWATFEITNQPVILLGTVELFGGDADPTRLRLHAVCGSGSADNRITGEIVEMHGFRVGSADALAKAISDTAKAGAEARVSWRANKK